ncbi:hypothetical protein BVRB_9g206660 [Beta vulgaris subsp. vulgaris]|nr:hypothetical protein BVRB_9g206660 [Beta vulgaris subsp. vulgaris]
MSGISPLRLLDLKLSTRSSPRRLSVWPLMRPLRA